jgi:hypothetical protein
MSVQDVETPETPTPEFHLADVTADGAKSLGFLSRISSVLCAKRPDFPRRWTAAVLS